MKCPNCRFENQQDARFCNQCGSKLKTGRPASGTVNLPESNFCKGCGQDLARPEEAVSIDYSQLQSYTPRYLGLPQ